MARRQYSSCRTVNRMGTFAPALSQPSGQEFSCAWIWTLGGLLGDWPWCSHLNVESRGLSPSAKGRRRSPTTGAPPDGR